MVNNNFKITFLDFKELTKAGLSISVVFSALAGYLLAVETVNWLDILFLTMGGYLMVGSSNTFNQVIEKDKDKLMKRTQNRPLPSGRISKKTGLIIAFACSITGLYLLHFLNFKTFILGATSIALYVLVYTPLKSVTPLSVFVGAFPGAIPFSLGWLAATNTFDEVCLFLFLFQFIWQFPHFWAIAWLLDEDYKKAGFKLLPTGEKNNITTFQIFLYTLVMILISLFPMSGFLPNLNLSLIAGILVFLMGVYILRFAVKMIKEKNNKSAKKMMLGAVLYLPIIQLIYVIDKFLNS